MRRYGHYCRLCYLGDSGDRSSQNSPGNRVWADWPKIVSRRTGHRRPWRSATLPDRVLRSNRVLPGEPEAQFHAPPSGPLGRALRRVCLHRNVLDCHAALEVSSDAYSHGVHHCDHHAHRLRRPSHFADRAPLFSVTRTDGGGFDLEILFAEAFQGAVSNFAKCAIEEMVARQKRQYGSAALLHSASRAL